MLTVDGHTAGTQFENDRPMISGLAATRLSVPAGIVGLFYAKEDIMAKKKTTETTWQEFDFNGGAGFKAPAYDRPTCKVSKSTLSFYQTDLQHDQEVKILVGQNGRFAIQPFKGGPKKLKGNKAGTRVSLASRKLVRSLGLVDDTDTVRKKELHGRKEVIQDVGTAWVFG